MRTRLLWTLMVAMTINGPMAFAQDTVSLAVADEYVTSCAVCHGEDGRGHGEFSKVLKTPPPDLTMLARENDGTFPFEEVFHVIDGRTLVGAHGTRDMPIWGRRYTEEIGEKFGPYGGETAVRARVLELVYYIQSLQQ